MKRNYLAMVILFGTLINFSFYNANGMRKNVLPRASRGISIGFLRPGILFMPTQSFFEKRPNMTEMRYKRFLESQIARFKLNSKELDGVIRKINKMSDKEFKLQVKSSLGYVEDRIKQLRDRIGQLKNLRVDVTNTKKDMEGKLNVLKKYYNALKERKKRALIEFIKERVGEINSLVAKLKERVEELKK